MALRPLAAAIVVALPSLAAAGPFTAGVHLGITQSKEDGAAGLEPNDTLGLFGRLQLSPRIAGQLEAQKIKTDAGNVDIRTGTASLVIDLVAKGRLIPTLAVGMGIDSATTSYGSETNGHHFEGGFGLEYRADGGLVLGGEFRMGGRSLEQSDKVVPLAEGDLAYYVAPSLREGEYRSVRLFLGVRFK
ncbi:MAG: hypothetical protein JNL83_31995 [Myxococcales bacterium]|nr:hypothetical protein [Myxococcales bacterium]